MIEWKEEWGKNMDGGEKFVQARVRRARPAVDAETTHENDVGHAIDYALATACIAAESPKGAVYHLNYMIAELTKAKRNIQKEIPE